MRAPLLLVLLPALTLAVDPACYALIGGESSSSPKNAPVSCPNGAVARDCFMLCGLCSVPDLRMGFDHGLAQTYCQGAPVPGSDTVAGLAVNPLPPFLFTPQRLLVFPPLSSAAVVSLL